MIQTGGRTLFCVRVMEKTSTGFCWGSRAVIPLEVTMTVSAGGPIFCFVVKFIEVTMTVVKSVSDGLRNCESETQLNLNQPLRISPGPRHLSRPLAAISTYANRPAGEDPNAQFFARAIEPRHRPPGQQWILDEGLRGGVRVRRPFGARRRIPVRGSAR